MFCCTHTHNTSTVRSCALLTNGMSPFAIHDMSCLYRNDPLSYLHSTNINGRRSDALLLACVHLLLRLCCMLTMFCRVSLSCSHLFFLTVLHCGNTHFSPKYCIFALCCNYLLIPPPLCLPHLHVCLCLSVSLPICFFPSLPVVTSCLVSSFLIRWLIHLSPSLSLSVVSAKSCNILYCLCAVLCAVFAILVR